MGVIGKWWAEGSERAGGTDPLDPRKGPCWTAWCRVKGRSWRPVASFRLCVPPDRDHAVT